MDSACICTRRTRAKTDSADYQEWTSDGDNVAIFKEGGFIIYRQLLSVDEVEEVKLNISKIIREWLKKYDKMPGPVDDTDQLVNRLPEVLTGALVPKDPELGIRKLFRMSCRTTYFRDLCQHPKIVSVMKQLLGADIKLLQSMALLKPPGSGEKIWHQDNAYFRLIPSKVVGCWIAIDEAMCANGCMHILPSSHGTGIYKHEGPATSSFKHIDYGMVDTPKPDDVLSIALKPGDALIFHGELAHHTPPNVTDLRRRAVQFHYAASECKPAKCPKDKQQPVPHAPGKPYYFDCDPDCQEPEYWAYRKAELTVCGKEVCGDDYI